MKHFIIVLTFIMLLTGCVAKQEIKQTAQPEKKDMALIGKKVLMVIAPKDFRDAEYNEPRKIFDQSGLEVKVASIQGGTSVGAEGTIVKIDLTVSEVKVDEFDAVAFIGGPGMAQIINDESLQMLASKFYQAGKLTTAICVAPAILAKAGILADKQATAWSGARDDLEAGRANFTGQAVTIDSKIITADGPGSAQEFGEKIVQALE